MEDTYKTLKLVHLTISGNCKVNPPVLTAEVGDVLKIKSALPVVTIVFENPPATPFSEPPPYIVRKLGSNEFTIVNAGEYTYNLVDEGVKCKELADGPPKMIIRG